MNDQQQLAEIKKIENQSILNSDRTIGDRAEQIIRNEILINQTELVDMLQGNDGQFYSDSIANLDNEICPECKVSIDDAYLDGDECPYCHKIMDEIEYQEKAIYSWWLVTGHLADELEAIGEPMIRNDYGDWWGRTVLGQEISADGTKRVVKRMDFSFKERCRQMDANK